MTGLPDGVTAAKAVIPANQPGVEVALTAAPAAAVCVGMVRVTGKGVVAVAKAVERVAVLPGVNGLPDAERVAVAVAVPTPFQFTGEYTMSSAPRGQPYRRSYKLERNGFAGPIAVTLADRQARHLQGVTGPTVVVPPGKNDFEYAAELPPWIEIGRTCRACIMATGTVKDADGREHAVCFTSAEQNHQMIVVPEPGRLAVEAVKSTVAVGPGEEVRVPFRVARAKGLAGAVKVELVVPVHWLGVTAEPATVPADAQAGELTIRVGKDAPAFNMPATLRATLGDAVAEAKVELLRRE